MEIVFATNNQHKLKEVQQAVGSRFTILSLNDIGFDGEIPETNPSIEANAKQKAQYIFDRYHKACFADDTGLEIDALNGAPGVYSARYAGEDCSFEDNCNLVLKNLGGKANRKAHFKTVIAYITDSGVELFEGIVNGVILEDFVGTEGFGYDPIFRPDGFEESFAEMSMELKNSISHRGLATRKFLKHLENSSKK